MAVSIWRYLLVDRIGITGVIPSGNLYKHVYGQFFTLMDEQKQLLPEGKVIIRKYKYSMRLDYYAAYTYKKAGRRKIADITLGSRKLPGKKGLHRYLTLTMYPSQFQANEFENFKSVFDMLFDPISYPMLYHTGKVNYLELAADSLSHQHHTFLPYRKYVTVSDIYKQGASYLGTTYIGSVSSGLRFRIYDKHKQSIDTGKTTFTKILPQTRVEAVLRRLGVAPTDLINMNNPFDALQIADLELALAASKNVDWRGFIADSREVGVPRALSSRPDKRKAYLKMLDDIPVSWWKPANIWKDLPGALDKIAP